MSLELTMFPAGEGDALWLRWGPERDRRQMIVDMGVAASGRAWRNRLSASPIDRRKIDLLVVTHVDSDHIYGVLSALVEEEPIEGVEIADVWFNGWKHLEGGIVEPIRSCAEQEEEDLSDARRQLFGDGLESYGGRQGEELSIWLRKQPWNRAFGGGPVMRLEGEAGPQVTLDFDLRISVLGPTPEQLRAMKPDWGKAVSEAIKKGSLDPQDVAEELAPAGLEPMGGRKPTAPDLSTVDSLRDLADSAFCSDKKAANGSSIALLVEFEGERVLLAGDAHPAGLVEAIEHQFPEGPPKLSAFKLPHHGSKNNVSRELVEAVRCNRWLFSTNGVKHYHPDAEAVARVIQHASSPADDSRDPVLYFNEPSEFNCWWDDDEWKHRFRYKTVYGHEESGISLLLG